jgi:hypothetical protein
VKTVGKAIRGQILVGSILNVLVAEQALDYLPYVCDLDSNTAEHVEEQPTSTSVVLECENKDTDTATLNQ